MAMAPRRRSGDPRGLKNRLQLACANDGIHFRNIFTDLVAVTFDEAAGNDQFGCPAFSFEASHFENGVDRLLLGRVDKTAGIDDEDFRFLGPRRQACAGMVKQAHHDLGIDEILGTAERNKAHGRRRG